MARTDAVIGAERGLRSARAVAGAQPALGLRAGVLDLRAGRRLGGAGAQRRVHAVRAAVAQFRPGAHLDGCAVGRACDQHRPDALSRAGRLPDQRGAGRPDRDSDVAQRHRQLVLRSHRLGRLPDAQDRVPAGGDPLARRLRRLEDHHHRHRRDLSGDRRDRHRDPRRRARADLVGAQHGREQSRADVAGRAARRRCRRFSPACRSRCRSR